MISTELIEPKNGIDKDDDMQDRYSNDDGDEEDDDDNPTLSITVMHEDCKLICKLGDTHKHEKSFNVSKNYNYNTYLYQKQTNLRLHDSRLGGISCLNCDKDESKDYHHYSKLNILKDDISLETNKANSQKVTKETQFCFKAISSLDKFKKSSPFHINKKQTTTYQKQQHNNETVNETSNLKTRHCIINNSIVYLIELLVVSIFVTIFNDHTKLVPFKYVSALDEIPLPLPVPIEKALVPLVTSSSSSSSSSVKSDSLNESSLIWPIITGNSSVQLPTTSQQRTTTSSKAVIETPIQANDDDDASKQRSLHLLQIQFVESLASLSSLLQAASRADSIVQPQVITAPNHGTIGVESVESVVKVPTISATATSQTYLEQPSEIMEDYSSEQDLQVQDAASDTANSLPSKTFQLFSFAGFGGGTGSSIGSGVGLGSTGGSKRRDLQMQTKAINPRGLLSLDSSNNLILPQMHQIKSRFNQGCVGGTKCQFFAFCWMSGGSLGASCGLLMTCCVTPSKTEIQPVFYGPVINDPYCGRSTSKISRIVGGTDASFGQFPWQAFVQVGGSRCGGALISSRHVVTAGHCVARSQHSPSSIKVTLGDYILNSDIESLPHEVFSVVEVLLHPNFRFTPQADRYDVAVLELDRVAQYKDNIKPICLPQKDSSFVGRVAYVAGWGALQAGSKLRPKVLQHVAVPVIENNVCESWHRRKGIDIRIYDEMMCAGYEMGQRDACQGDSGGPLMLNQFGVWYLVGIVSAGYSCAKQYQPGIYHRVSSSSDWISSNLDRI